jgi:hypothetical protein
LSSKGWILVVGELAIRALYKGHREKHLALAHRKISIRAIFVRTAPHGPLREGNWTFSLVSISTFATPDERPKPFCGLKVGQS